MTQDTKVKQKHVHTHTHFFVLLFLALYFAQWDSEPGQVKDHNG